VNSHPTQLNRWIECYMHISPTCYLLLLGMQHNWENATGFEHRCWLCLLRGQLARFRPWIRTSTLASYASRGFLIILPLTKRVLKIYKKINISRLDFPRVRKTKTDQLLDFPFNPSIFLVWEKLKQINFSITSCYVPSRAWYIWSKDPSSLDQFICKHCMCLC
jgi:hypothetical protein